MDVKQYRLRSEEYDRILGWGAALSEVEDSMNQMERRFRAIPNGWRDVKLCSRLLEKLLDGLIDTVPMEKRPSLAISARRQHFRSVIGPIFAANPTPEWMPLLMDDVDQFVAAALEKCSMCVTWKCDRCKLGKALDHALRYDRQGKCWATITPESLARGGETDDHD